MKTAMPNPNQPPRSLRKMCRNWQLIAFAGVMLSGCATTPSVCPEAVQTAVQKSLEIERGTACTKACWQEKQAIFQEAVQRCPANAEAHHYLGQAEMQLRRYPEAVAAFQNAIRLDPALAEAYFRLGDLAMQSGDYVQAASYYQQGLQLNPADPLNKRQQRVIAENLAKSVENNGALKSTDMVAILGGRGETLAKPGGVGLVRGRTPNSVINTENRRLVLYIPFDAGSAHPKPEAKAVLYDLGAALRQILANPESKNAAFLIEGHTDATGSAEQNLVLSEQRADRVRQVLTDNFGVPRQRLAVMPYGQTRPLSRGSKPADHARNRRVEVVRIPDMAGETGGNASYMDVDSMVRFIQNGL